MNLLGIIPLPYKLLAMALLAVALVGYGWVKGANSVQDDWESANNKEAARQAGVAVRQAEATVKIVTQYIDRVKVIKEKGDTIVKEVPVYVTQNADSNCTVNVGFVRLHDFAATNTIPEAPGSTDENPSGIALSAVAETVAGNYSTCYQIREQLVNLQEWVTTQEQISNEGVK